MKAFYEPTEPQDLVTKGFVEDEIFGGVELAVTF